MKVSIFTRFPYVDDDMPGGWPGSADHYRPDRAARSLREGLALVDDAVALGFDMVTVAEHHFGPDSLAPDPVTMAAALCQRHPDVTIAALGPVLPLWDPVRLAESLALVDVLSGGRLVVGLFRGTLTELIAYGVPPVQARDRFEEGLDLLLCAWTDPGPFAWDGTHFRRRMVAVWPRPHQQPHPPVFVAAGRPDAARAVGRRGLGLGLLGQVTPPEQAATLAAAHREGRIIAGDALWEDGVLWRGRIHVAPTDAEAEADHREHALGDSAVLLAPPTRAGERTRRLMGNALGRDEPSPATPPGRIELLGSPDTVADRLLELASQIGFGIADLMFSHPRLPHEKARRSVALFGRHVLPRLRARQPFAERLSLCDESKMSEVPTP